MNFRGSTRKSAWIARLALLAGSIVLSLAALEGIVRLMVEQGFMKSSVPPRLEGRFWNPNDDRFGVWHRPNATTRHRTDSFHLPYRTNSVGARDIERPLESSQPRVVLLGDSFIEGWGLPRNQRLGDRLERMTGMPHLNFGMSHFGPYQGFLAYRELAKQYAHDFVLLGVLPENDFFDMDLERARTRPYYEYRYRPYLAGSYPDYREIRLEEGTLHRALRTRSYAFNAVSHALMGFSKQDPEPVQKQLVRSGFYDFSDADFDRLRYVIERILEEADGRRVAVVLIPTLKDFQRFGQTEGQPPPLTATLLKFSAGRELRIVDLLAPFFHQTPRHGKYYFEGDYHWNAHGNAVAAGIVAEELRGFFYDAPAGNGAEFSEDSRASDH